MSSTSLKKSESSTAKYSFGLTEFKSLQEKNKQYNQTLVDLKRKFEEIESAESYEEDFPSTITLSATASPIPESSILSSPRTFMSGDLESYYTAHDSTNQKNANHQLQEQYRRAFELVNYINNAPLGTTIEDILNDNMFSDILVPRNLKL
ncbi:hypothetical protein G6F56_008367 [Rhizopus delemar]|nr:hypothetical protein G6F56_008367 [Rhizopus delemar]